MILKLKRTPGIYLVGFMGCGKTTVGRMLADKIGWRFVCIDEEIEAAQKRTIAEIFDTEGEQKFREIETAAIRQYVRKVQAGHPMVLALGGGAVTQQENLDLLANNGVTIWLDVQFEVLQKRVEAASHRPLARDPEKFRQLYDTRLPLYEKSEYRIVVQGGDSRNALEQILELPLFHV